MSGGARPERAAGGEGRPGAAWAAGLEELPGVGPARLRELHAQGYRCVGDLLLHLPRRFEDRRRVSPLAEVRSPGRYTVSGRLRGVSKLRLRRGVTLVRATVADASGELAAAWFNRPYLDRQSDGATEYLLHGEVRQRGERLELVNASVEPRAGGGGPRLAPIYAPIGSLGPGLVARLVAAALERVDPRRLADPLPAALLERHRLPTLGAALARLHRPDADATMAPLAERRDPAHRRLVYGELLALQLELAARRRRRVRKRHRYSLGDDFVDRFARRLPFVLTSAQRRVAAEIAGDLAGERPMRRLLQGDVGCGKTVVAALALEAARASGLQSALMAPTELLAEQHWRSLAALLADPAPALLTASSADAAGVRRRLAAGRLEPVVGTHALIQERIGFANLGLVVIDEQHRFGVDQRRRLAAKGSAPDLLVMTATPIPRSLALTVYGDLDLSLIDELPPGRTPVATRVVPRAEERVAYSRLESELAAGHRAYVVLPLIDDSDRVAAVSIAARGEELMERYAAFAPVVIHGRLDAAERDERMRAFAAGEARLLVATTIVEVGVDVPEASVMVIESAERFGLAQLHQLRGRVGRGGRASWCFALHGGLGTEAASRLEIFAATDDGFRLAEADLELRGPGELSGKRQAGVPLFRLARLSADGEWLEKARRDARELAATAPASFRRLLAAGRRTGLL